MLLVLPNKFFKKNKQLSMMGNEIDDSCKSLKRTRINLNNHDIFFTLLLKRLNKKRDLFRRKIISTQYFGYIFE